MFFICVIELIKIKTCSAIPKDKSFSNQSAIDTVKGVVGFDWSKYHTENSNSILVEHTAITTPIKVMIAATHLAVGNKNQANINLAKNLLLEIAKANTLHNSIGYEELKTKPFEDRKFQFIYICSLSSNTQVTNCLKFAIKLHIKLFFLVNFFMIS